MQKNNALFITIEGVEGVGKSTNIESVRQYLDGKNIEYIVTREPGGTLLAEKIRTLLLEIDSDAPVELSELLLIFAARAQHLETLIKPALASGKWVICDRFTDATYAYQGGGRGMNRDAISTLETLVQGQLKPDLTIILDLDPSTGIKRAQSRGTLDRFERENLKFFEKVRACYLEIAAAEPERCLIIDASKDQESVKLAMIAALDKRID